MNFQSPLIFHSHLPPLSFTMEHISERPSRAYRESAKVVTTLNNPTLSTWTPSGTRSTRQKPSQPQPALRKPSLVYKRARYFDPTLGRFVGRDPMGYVDGENLFCSYFGVSYFDPTGTISAGPGPGIAIALFASIFCTGSGVAALLDAVLSGESGPSGEALCIALSGCSIGFCRTARAGCLWNPVQGQIIRNLERMFGNICDKFRDVFCTKCQSQAQPSGSSNCR